MASLGAATRTAETGGARGDLLAPCVIMVAPNGARRGREDHPALPVTADELAATAEACRAAGASCLHFHARDAAGLHSLDAEICRAWLGRVKDLLPIQLTTEAAGRYRPDAQMALVQVLKPPAISLALRELLPDQEPAPAVQDFLDWVHAHGISPQYILYTPDEVARFEGLRRARVIPQARPFAIFVLGRYAERDRPTQPRDLLEFLERHDPDCPWSACAFGRTETAALALAASLGGHVRVGFENSLENADGSIAGSNAERVDRIASLVGALGRPIGTASDARNLLAEAAL